MTSDYESIAKREVRKCYKAVCCQLQQFYGLETEVDLTGTDTDDCFCPEYLAEQGNMNVLYEYQICKAKVVADRDELTLMVQIASDHNFCRWEDLVDGPHSSSLSPYAIFRLYDVVTELIIK